MSSADRNCDYEVLFLFAEDSPRNKEEIAMVGSWRWQRSCVMSWRHRYRDYVVFLMTPLDSVPARRCGGWLLLFRVRLRSCTRDSVSDSGRKSSDD